jgi:hypothetical protein
MMNDRRLYKDPECFMPERFLGENPEKDPRAMAFGFGRRYCIFTHKSTFLHDYGRICPGRLLADETLFIVCAMSIAVFDIQKSMKNGVVVEPIRRVAPGFIRQVK